MKNNYDIIVVGGGFAGVGAAIAAARGGADVLLIERYGFLGGAATMSLVNPFMPFERVVNGERRLVNSGIFKTILARLDELDARKGRMFNEELLKLVLDRLLEENRIKVLFHSYLTEAETENGRIKSVTVVNKSSKRNLFAKAFIDCTGDADLSVLAGCPCYLGREKDNLCQPMTLCFRVANIDSEKFKGEYSCVRTANSNIANPLFKEFRTAGKIKNPREDVLLFPHMVDNILHFNATRIIKRNPVDAEDLTVAEKEAREQAYELYMFYKKNIPGFENSVLLSSAPQIGIRESRMIDGEYKITQEDILGCKKFDDSVARGNYCIDIHNPDGEGTTIVRLPENEYYTIPYRALIPKGVSNLLTAGRCISSTHEAQSSYRIMPICCCIGEAAGVAAGLAAKQECSMNSVSVEEIRTSLQKFGALV